MIGTVNERLIQPLSRQLDQAVLFCSGGGIPALFFSTGAMGRLLQQGENLSTFDVVSATSAGALLCRLIETCYDHNLVRPRDGGAWFRRHVRPNVLAFVQTDLPQLFPIILRWLLTQNASDYDFIVRAFTRRFETGLPFGRRRLRRHPTKKKPQFFYNYVDANTLELTADVTPLLSGPDDPLRTGKILLACVTPFAFHNATTSSSTTTTNGSHTSIDGGIVDNCMSTWVLNRFAPTRRCVVLSLTDYYFYDYYDPPPSVFAVAAKLIFNFGSFADLNSVRFSTDLIDPSTTSLVTISSERRPSNDPVHLGLFTNYNQQHSLIDLYNYWQINRLLILENEGYLQATAATTAASAATPSNNIVLPNPQVYSSAAVRGVFPIVPTFLGQRWDGI